MSLLSEGLGWCFSFCFTDVLHPAILGKHGKKKNFKNLLRFFRYAVTYGTFCVTYGTVKGESLKVKVYFKCIEGILEGFYPSQILQITWNLSNESYFQCSFYFSGVLWYKRWWSMFLVPYVTTGHWWLLTQPLGV